MDYFLLKRSVIGSVLEVQELLWRSQCSRISASQLDLTQGDNSQTAFVIAQHPVAFDIKNDYFDNIDRSVLINT